MKHLVLSSTQIELSCQEQKHGNALCGKHGAYQIINKKELHTL